MAASTQRADTSVDGSATLRHVATGQAMLLWSAQTQELGVTLDLTGLAPNSTHPAHIHLGYCGQNGPIGYYLQNIVANAYGNAHTVSLAMNANGTPVKIPGGIPAGQWYINVHNGPTLATADQMAAVACGNIANVDTSGADTSAEETATVRLHGDNSPNQNASGMAQVHLADGQATVQIFVRGLQPDSMHAWHIHAGSCQSQGPVLINFGDAQADGDGTIDTTVTVSASAFTSVPASGWYINVHYGSMAQLGTQTGFDPVVCGNVQQD